MVVKMVNSEAHTPFGMSSKVETVRELLEAKNAELLTHRYFERCRAGDVGRAELVGVLKQLYCFSVFYERLLMRRIGDFTDDGDPRVLQLAREHLLEEGRHVDRFRTCLEKNGVTEEELTNLTPKMFTKAMFGYLMATVEHESEYIANIALMQVMESISPHFFTATYQAMSSHSMTALGIIDEHAHEEHANLGFELIEDFDDAMLTDARRTIDDLYRLFGFMLEDWMDERASKHSMTVPRDRRADGSAEGALSA